MKVTIRRVAGDQPDQLEDIINRFLAQPGNEKLQLATAFPTADGANIILIFNHLPA